MYLNLETLSNQSNYAPGLVLLTEEQKNMYIQYNGFITIKNTDPIIIEPDIDTWEKWKSEQSGPLNNLKNDRISQSKIDLKIYLANHPLLWTDGEYYSITAEKQNQLTSKIMVATMAQELSQEYNLTWNSTGETCKTWTLQDLKALAFAIDKRVTKLVSYQQEKEVEIKKAQNEEALKNIVIDYNSVL